MITDFPTRWLLIGCLAAIGLVFLIAYDTNRTVHAVEHIQADRWTGSDMRRWREELLIRNPDLDIPEAVNKP